jgi:hypothetical protein
MQNPEAVPSAHFQTITLIFILTLNAQNVNIKIPACIQVAFLPGCQKQKSYPESQNSDFGSFCWDVRSKKATQNANTAISVAFAGMSEAKKLPKMPIQRFR